MSEEILGAEQDIRSGPITAEIASHLRCKPGTIGMCALRRYIIKQDTLIASYDWHWRKIRLPHEDVAGHLTDEAYEKRSLIAD